MLHMHAFILTNIILHIHTNSFLSNKYRHMPYDFTCCHIERIIFVCMYIHTFIYMLTYTYMHINTLDVLMFTCMCVFACAHACS